MEIKEIQVRDAPGNRSYITIIQRDAQTDRITSAIRLTRPTTETPSEVEKWEKRGFTLTQVNGEMIND